MELVATHPPYDARRMLWFLGLHATPGLETIERVGAEWRYGRVLRLAGGPGVALVTSAGDGYAVDLDLHDTADEAEALGRLGHLLDLDRDPSAALGALSADGLLGPLVRARPGVRAPGTVDPFATVISTIIGQQISLAGARTVIGRVVAGRGDPLPAGLARAGLTHGFPTPAALAATDPETLPMPRARGRSVVAVARAVAERGGWLASGAPDARADLLALPGVGPWTAAYVALRSARSPDEFLPTDLAVRRAFERHGRPGDPAAAAAASAAWSPHRSLALMHLWVDLLESRGA